MHSSTTEVRTRHIWIFHKWAPVTCLDPTSIGKYIFLFYLGFVSAAGYCQHILKEAWLVAESGVKLRFLWPLCNKYWWKFVWQLCNTHIALHCIGTHCRPLWPILEQFFVCDENLWTVMRLLYLNLSCSMGIVHFSQFTISCRTDHQYIDISIYDYWFLLYFKIIDIIDQGIGKCPAD